MDKVLFVNYPKDKRVQMLEDNSDKVEELDYAKVLTQKELGEVKSELSEQMLQVKSLEDKKAAFMENLKMEMKPVKDSLNENLETVKMGARMVTERCFKIIDQQEGQVGYYNSEGKLVKERPILPDEKQGTVFQMKREAVNE